MNIASIRFNVARDNAEIVLNSGQNELFACAMKMKKMGMTPTPPWAGKEAARRGAHGLLDKEPNGEPKAVGLPLDFEAMR